jgi:organic hydroperoxide reductase OsmC/OhrA
VELSAKTLGRMGIQKVAMSEHRAKIIWNRSSGDFSYETYTRDHIWEFENGAKIEASAAPGFRGSPKNVDPEEAYVASISSCHMLTFLAIAARKRFVVDSYTDSAVGHLEKNANGKLAVTRVALRPKVSFSEEACPSSEELERLHHLAHAECFIANSVHTSISVEGG